MLEKNIGNIEPKIVWSIFEEITTIPRPSKKEDKIRKWVRNWANEKGITQIKEDSVGNILLRKEASKGCENYPTLVLQAHLDMVCQKEQSIVFDCEKDPIITFIDGEKVAAKGTSLGADNGIGISCALAALISNDLKHGSLEVLLTVDEETGMTGAFGLKSGFFSGKYLLNVDSENIGTVTISSAGGGGTDIVMPITFEEKSNHQGFKLTINGLLGGHSGVDIDLPRLNAIKVGIDAFMDIKDSILFVSLNGGSVHNAIPRDFECEFVAQKEQAKRILKHLKQWKKSTLLLAKTSEPGIKIDIKDLKINRSISSEKTTSLLNILDDIEHGPLTYSKQITGLVQTSSNLAVIKSDAKYIQIHVSTRSSVDEELESVRKEIKEIGEKYKAKVTLDKAYPGWMPNPESPFVKMVKRVYEEVLEKPVILEAIHAGLECGLFVALDPDLQVTSIGPNIHNAHSPDEYVEIKSVEIIWNVVKKIIENMNKL
ncbi:MAG: beta-Ala-His dipeptidase [Candidatus Heimdallarchaeota archaeon]|nr:beta-Ala-His dipeptidase [Candidatus Heimdallarchaeota archaeon]